MRIWTNLLMAALSVSTSANAFVPASMKTFVVRSPATTTARYSSWDSDDCESSNGPLKHNMARTDIRNFLTQRSVQSFMFLCEQCRDPHTGLWLQDVLLNYHGKLLNFHGTGAFNMTLFPTWDSVLLDLMSRTKDVVIVSARSRAGRGRGGWSKDNPYLEDQFVEFEIDIDPVSLASRIISVREQLAAEWTKDFDTMIIANEMILSSYAANMMNERDEEEEFDSEHDDDEEETSHPDHNLNALTAPYSENKGDSAKRLAFDRNAMQMLLNQNAFEAKQSSPLRKGNFDLMLLLSTQESIHRVLREYMKAGEEKEVSFKWLRDFYTDRVGDYFDGDQRYGRADDFLEEMLLTPPSVKNMDGTMGLTDPLGIAEEIIRMRSTVAREWKETMSQVPQDHMDLRKSLLLRQMYQAMEPQAVAQTEVIEGGNFE